MPTAPPGGYHGRALAIDVSRGSCDDVPLERDLLRRAIGGVGLGTELLLKATTAALPACAPEAPLIFAFSPLVGSPLTTSAKFAVVHKSPLTDRINDSLASSGFAIRGKAAGGDALVITGRANRWSVLVIDNGDVRLDDAGDLMGRTIQDTEAALAERYGGGFNFAVIGPAGERQIPFATLSHDGRHAGRGGAGAVLGSKQIKAIAVCGEQRTPWHDQAELIRVAKDLSARSFGPATAKYRELGTAANLLTFNRLGTLPTRNFQQGEFEQAVALAPETLSLAREKTRASCVACTIGCEHIYTLGDKHERKTVRLEYENLFALGPLCGIGDAEAVLAASQRCDQLGLDTISTGGTIAFAMECVERGLLAAPWLRFGNGEALARAIEELAERSTDVGKLLSLGSRRMGAALGGDAIHFAAQIKGLELPGYEPRALRTMALGLAVGARGADHNRSGAYEADFSPDVDRRAFSPRTAELAIETEDRAALIDSLILCKFLRGVFSDLWSEAAEMLRLVTGLHYAADELRSAARGIVNAKKRFNIAAGWTSAEDTLPARFFADALSPDTPGIDRVEFAAAVRRYYELRGWRADGYL